MLQSPTQVLLVEDSPTDLDMLRRAFARSPDNTWHLADVDTLDAAILAYQSYQQISPDAQTFDVVLLDLGLPDSHGIETLERFQQAAPDAAVVVLTGLDDDDIALQSIEAGAQDYLVKDDISLPRLQQTIRFAMQRQQLVQSVRENEARSRRALAAEREFYQLKNNFTKLIAQRFCDPLNVLQGAIERLEQQLSKALAVNSAPIDVVLETIRRSSQQLAHMINDVITFSRLQAGEFMPTIQAWNLEILAREVIDTFELELHPGQHINLTQTGDLRQFHTDRNLVWWILTNLISNALKYSRHPQDIDIHLQMAAGQLLLRVQDRGIGIPASEQAKLGDSFYRASNVQDLPGTGLGLAIVNRCVAALDGEMHIQSRVDYGTTIEICLPDLPVSTRVVPM